jgi:hypothetical protein
MENKKFMFYENFWNAIEQLPEEQKTIACYEFCKYGITGQLPDNPMMKMFCIGVSASVQKYQGRGGSRVGAGRPKKQLNQEDNENQKIQKNQNNQKIHNTQTETKNININKSINNKYNYYGELKNVKLTEEEYNKLSAEHTNLDQAIEKLDTWLGTSGSKNKNKPHYAYFKSNSWVWDNIKPKTKELVW